MKRISIAFVMVCFMSILNLFGQQSTATIDQMDLSAVSTGILLNKGFGTEKYLDQYRNARMDGKFRVFQCTPDAWKVLYKSIRNSEVNIKSLKDFSDYIPEDSDAQHAMGTVPVGLLNFTGQYLTPDQLKENIKQKSKGKKADGSGYEKVRIVALAPMRQDLYSGEVTLDFSDRFRFGNNHESLEDLSVDFRDGKGFQKIESGNARMTHRYTTPGNKILTFRYTVGGTSYQSHSEVHIRTVEPYPFDKTFKVTAQPVIGENAGGRTINGATVAVMLGCDKVFDKPIIIVEGFDYNNSRGINTIANNYFQNYSNGTAFGVFGRLLSHGYDMVIVNFNDATDYIQNNANVLINVIQAVNWDKTGYAPNMVIGESNGGIIARYALRKMEQQSMTHNVNYFVSFDSPQKGANVPEGVIRLLQQVRASGIIAVDDFIDKFVPGDYSLFGLTDLKALLKSATTPAARQVLFKYLTSGGQVEQSSLFSSLQSELDGMGYPQNCTNLAVVNGSIFNTAQTTRTYGAVETQGMEMYNQERVQDVYSFHAIAKTNTINTNFEVAWFHIYLFANPGPYDYSGYLNSPLNRDLCPGSYQDEIAQQGGRNFRFSFVPTYSAIGYNGSINSDSDQYLSNAASASSPFNKIYGDGINSEHINVNQEEAAWTSLFSEKLGINGYASSCPAPSAYYGPVPVFNSPSVICLNDVYTFDASGTGFAGQNLSYSWKIKIMFGPNADQVVATGSSSTYSMYGANYATGDYEIICKAYYPGHETEGYESSRTVYIDRSCDHSSGRRPSISEPETGTVFAVTPNPAANKATVRLRIPDGLTGNIRVTAINGKSIFQRSVIGSGLEQQTDLDVSTLSPGIYLISLEAGQIKERQKLVVTR